MNNTELFEGNIMRDFIVDIANIYRPFETAYENNLKDIITNCHKFAPNCSDDIQAEVMAELNGRYERAAKGPTFVSNERVQVIEDILWWPQATSAKPPVGIVGIVIKPSVPLNERWAKDCDYTGMVPVRFLSTDVGYEWEEGDEEDRKYVTYNMPNYALERLL